MAIGAFLVVIASVQNSLPLFLFGFIVLFILTGIGNGSIYKMIPQGFRTKPIERLRPVRTSSRRIVPLVG